MDECAKKIHEVTQERCLEGDGFFIYSSKGKHKNKCSCCTTYDAPTNVKETVDMNLYKLDLDVPFKNIRFEEGLIRLRDPE